MSSVTPSSGVSSLDSSITRTAACLNGSVSHGSVVLVVLAPVVDVVLELVAVVVLSVGGGPGSMYTALGSLRVSANGVTEFQRMPIALCTLSGSVMPFCVMVMASASGCQRFGSFITVPGSFTTSGSFTGA